MAACTYTYGTTTRIGCTRQWPIIDVRRTRSKALTEYSLPKVPYPQRKRACMIEVEYLLDKSEITTEIRPRSTLCCIQSTEAYGTAENGT